MRAHMRTIQAGCALARLLSECGLPLALLLHLLVLYSRMSITDHSTAESTASLLLLCDLLCLHALATATSYQLLMRPRLLWYVRPSSCPDPCLACHGTSS